MREAKDQNQWNAKSDRDRHPRTRQMPIIAKRQSPYVMTNGADLTDAAERKSKSIAFGAEKSSTKQYHDPRFASPKAVRQKQRPSASDGSTPAMIRNDFAHCVLSPILRRAAATAGGPGRRDRVPDTASAALDAQCIAESDSRR
jgi:hypothetical protein